jgi:hypothetical protein
MATIQKFEDLEIWQMARSLCQKIYPLTFVDLISKDFRYKIKFGEVAVPSWIILQKALVEKASLNS